MWWKAAAAGLLITVLAVAVIISVVIFTSNGDDDKKKPIRYVAAEYNTSLFEGDIAVMKTNMEYDGHMGTILREGVPHDRTWPGAVVPYELEQSRFTQKEIAMIADAIKDISRKTCVRFRERTEADGSYFLRITAEQGCWSHLGRTKYQFQNGQPLSLGEGCLNGGTIRHELMHALGFNHEQSRTDRDKYVRINYENIWPGAESQFVKSNDWEVTKLGTAYDFGSVMHYSAFAFSKDPSKPTIVKKADGSIYEAQRDGFSQTDIIEINKLYSCPSVQIRKTTTKSTRPLQKTTTKITHRGKTPTFLGHEYVYISFRKTWTAAEKECISWGGHLVSIHSAEENQFVASLYASDTSNRIVWIGYKYDKRRFHYQWSDHSQRIHMRKEETSATQIKTNEYENYLDYTCSVQEVLSKQENIWRFVLNVPCEWRYSFICKRKQR